MKFAKDLIIFLLINIFCVDLYIPLIMNFHITNNTLFQNFSICYCIVNFVNRFYLLPFCLLLIFKYTHSNETKKFIYCFKNNTKYQIYILILSFAISPIIGTIFSALLTQNFSYSSIIGSFQLSFIFNPFIGLYQAYLIMYFYWFIYKILKKHK